MPILESSPIIIRLANVRDKQKIIQLEKLAIKNLCINNYNVEEIEILTNNLSRLNFNDEIIFVAEKEHNLIGFASLLSYRKIVRTLYVKPNFIESKIATKLLNAIEKEAVRKKIDILKVTSSLTERAFYNSQGYQEIAFCPLAKMDLLVPGVAMEKELTPIERDDLLFKVLSQITLTTLINLFFLLLII